MAIIAPLISELDHEAKSTLRMLERVPGDKLDWTPHAKSMTLGKLAWHLATIPARVAVMLREASFDLTAARPSEVPDDAAAIASTFTRHTEELRALLGTMSDDDVRARFELRRGPHVVMEITKIGMLRNILLNHSYHHRGQLSVYLRLLDVPLPAIYGSSADEVPFG